MAYELQYEPQSQNPQIIHLRKSGVPPIPERAPESVQNRTFCTLFVQKVQFCTLSGALSGIGGNPTFCAGELLGDFGSVARTEVHNSWRQKAPFYKEKAFRDADYHDALQWFGCLCTRSLSSSIGVLFFSSVLPRSFQHWRQSFDNKFTVRVSVIIASMPLGQKSCRTKVPRNVWMFVPNFARNFAPNFPRNVWGVFVLRFAGNGDQKKLTKNPRNFSMQNSQANSKKEFTWVFWRAGKVTCHWNFSRTYNYKVWK